MPPRHLLAIPEPGMHMSDHLRYPTDFLLTDVRSGLVSVFDLAGASADDLGSYMASLTGYHDGAVVYLVTPPFALRSLNQSFAKCFMDDKTMFPHLDLDHVPESVEMGWREGLSLGIYVGDIHCLKQSGDPRF